MNISSEPMNDELEYPQNATPATNHRPLQIALASIASAGLIAAAAWGGPAWANGVVAHNAHLQAVAAQQQVAVAVPHLEAQTTAAADEGDTTSADDVVAAEKAREAAAALAAQQAAAQAAYAAAHARQSNVGADGLTHCPAGSSADAGDSSGATLCFPDICFHITLPDPAHPECETAFKP